MANLTSVSTLNSVGISFITLDDNKDHDTAISVYIKKGRKTIAQAERFASNIEFDDETESGSFTLGEIDKTITWEEIASGVTTRIEIDPVGNDTWYFSYKLVFRFSGGQIITMNHDKRIHLSERKTYREFEDSP